MSWLLKLYPRAWRDRYEDEVRGLLASEPNTLRLQLDLIAGAVDAHLNPHWTPANPAPEGEHPVTDFLHCAAHPRMTTHQARITGLATVIASAVVVGLMLLLQVAFGRSMYTRALLTTGMMVPIISYSLAVHLLRYTPRVRAVMVALILVAFYGFFLGANLLAHAI